MRALVRRKAGVYLAVPVLLTIMLATFDSRPTPGRVLNMFVMNVLISTAIGASITLLYRLLGPRVAPERRSPVVRWLFHAAVIGAGTAAGVELALRSASWISPPLTNMFPRIPVLQIAVPVAIVVVTVALTYDQLQNKTKEIELREERARRERLDAQLEALTARTNPHFLFNSLNTVAALITEDPDRAERAVERLASLFRYALDGSRTRRVSLASELEMVESYLELEKLRFGDRLSAALQIEERARSTLVPPLILQPLVENAVNHGVGSQRGPGRVEIRARIEGDSLVLEVEDDGPGPGASRHAGGSGTAQTDLEARLAINYGDRARLVRGPGKSGYLAQMVLPLTAPEGA
jgi:two-component system sensor histidine kinase AlgZ